MEVVLGGACLLYPKNSRDLALGVEGCCVPWHLPWLVAVRGFVVLVFFLIDMVG